MNASEEMQSIYNLNAGVMKIATHRRRVFIWKNNNRRLSVCGCNIGLLWFLLSGWKLTRGRKADVFLFSTGGVVELENVQDGLRILLLLRFTDVGRLKETGPLLRHALHKQTNTKIALTKPHRNMRSFLIKCLLVKKKELLFKLLGTCPTVFLLDWLVVCCKCVLVWHIYPPVCSPWSKSA